MTPSEKTKTQISKVLVIYVLTVILIIPSYRIYAQAMIVETTLEIEVANEITGRTQNITRQHENEPNRQAEERQAQDLQEPMMIMQPESEVQEDVNIKDFNDFERELNRINIESRSAQQEWLGPIERKVELAQAADELAVAELRFIRKLAQTEGAEQTVKGIDLVLNQRRDRLENLVSMLQEELRQDRQQQMPDRRERRATRTERTDRTDRTERTERVRERIPRRTREPRTEENNEQ